MTSPTNRDARERLAKVAAGTAINMAYPGPMTVEDFRADLRALLSPDEVEGMGSDQPLPSVATGHPEQDQGASRDHALTVGDGQGNPTLAASGKKTVREMRQWGGFLHGDFMPGVQGATANACWQKLKSHPTQTADHLRSIGFQVKPITIGWSK